MKLYIVRHGQSANNLNHDALGDMHTPLTDNGVAQARKVGLSFSGLTIDAIYCSEMLRAKQTLEKMLSFIKPKKVIYTKDLNEISRGRLTSYSAFLEEMNKAGLTQEDYRSQGGENFKDVVQRATKFWDELNKLHKNETVIVVTHQVFIKLFVERVLNIPIEWDIENASISSFDISEGVVDYDLNRRDHLADLPKLPDIPDNLEKKV